VDEEVLRAVRRGAVPQARLDARVAVVPVMPRCTTAALGTVLADGFVGEVPQTVPVVALTARRSRRRGRYVGIVDLELASSGAEMRPTREDGREQKTGVDYEVDGERRVFSGAQSDDDRPIYV